MCTVALENGWISADELATLSRGPGKSGCGQYLHRVAEEQVERARGAGFIGAAVCAT